MFSLIAKRANVSSKLTKLIFSSALILSGLSSTSYAQTQKRSAPHTERIAVVINERLAAVRNEPSLSARLIQRLGRGRKVSIIGPVKESDGVKFYRVAVSSRKRGWLQVDSAVRPAQKGEDEKLLSLIRASEDFDRISRARIFLDLFPKSKLCSTVLWLYGEAAEKAAVTLSREASRRLDEKEISVSNAPAHSHFMNYSGLDRYNRNGIRFKFDSRKKEFQYDGAGWSEIVRRYPNSPEADAARAKLNSLSSVAVK